MERYLATLRIPVFIYAPIARTGPPEHHSIAEIRKWHRREPRSLAFGEFWEDLKELLSRKHVFRTLAQGTRVEAEFDADSDRIRVKASSKSYLFGTEEIAELWGEMREHLVVTTKSFPARERELSYLFPILAELDYVDVMTLAGTPGQLASAPTHGLRLVPVEPAQLQRELVTV
jgi:hypothetical protein